MGSRIREPKMISSQEVADIVGVDPRTIQDMAKRGILTCEKKGSRNRYDLYTVIREYCEDKAKSAKRKYSSLEEEKTAEDIRLKSIKADTAEMALLELKGNLHAAEDVEAMTTELVLTVRSAFLAMPGRIAAELAEITDPTELSERLKGEVFDVLKDLSHYEYDPGEYRKRSRERRGWIMDDQEDRRENGRNQESE